MKAERAWGEQQIPPSWESRYGERFVMQRYSEKEWKQYEEEIGPDGQWLLERLEGESAPAKIGNLSEVQILKTVWAQQFREEEGELCYQDLKQYNGYEQIQTPHDPAARYGKKTDEFKQEYHQHRSGVEGSLSALIRGNGLRYSRYTSNKKRHLQAVFIAYTANLQRVARWQTGIRPQIRNSSNWKLVSAD